ncbi:MAG: DUF2264 domain-containing protein [Lachnospiraceae bacterium]
MKFEPSSTDYGLSPYTGMTRQGWVEAAEYLLQGIFENIADSDAPVVMPRKETRISYPHTGDDVLEKKAEYFEGLARSLFIAAPLIHEKPGLVLHGIKVRDYYKEHILRICSVNDAYSAGTYDEVMARGGDPNRCFQQTVETGALVICLWLCKSEIWDAYTKAEKDMIADFLTGYAHGNTVPQNWRLFNMLDMAFLHMEGYPIRKEVMLEHAQAIADYYAGDGWYRDGHSFDYYSVWAFQLYTPLWNLWYGYENVPYLAAKFEEYSNKLMESYGDFFDRDGYTNMWGRSGIYRNAATSAFAGNMLLRHSTANPGLARRIMSGSLLQFLTREDFLYKGVPTLGFYGQFTPLIQGYSCAESPFWLGKAFICLALPAEHPFWTARENNGIWDTLQEKEVKVTALDGPALCFSNHQANGATILRTGKVVKEPGDEHGMWNYSKLCFHTKYPWEAAPVSDVIVPGSVEAQQYVLHDLFHDSYEKCNVTFWHGRKGDVLYRRQFFHYRLSIESHWMQALSLADFAVPYGIVRVDKLRLHRQNIELTLGAYGFPDNGTEIRFLEKEHAKAVVLKGHDFTGREKQLAMTIYDGWEELSLVYSKGTNADSEKSIVPYAKSVRRKHYGNEAHILISQVITKESLEDFSEEDIFPIESIRYTDPEGNGGYGPVTIVLRNNRIVTVEFEEMEGRLEL